MPTYTQIAWLPLCGGLTGIGLVLSWAAWRKRGILAGLRGVAWSLLPMAAYLTGVVKLIWTFISAIANFAWSSVFSFQGWIGIFVTGLAVVLFAVTGGMKWVRLRRDRGSKPGTEVSAATRPGAPAGKQRPAVAATPVTGKRSAGAGDDDLADVADILKRHGIR